MKIERYSCTGYNLQPAHSCEFKDSEKYLIDSSPPRLHSEEHFRPGWISTPLRAWDLHRLVGIWLLMFYIENTFSNSFNIMHTLCPPSHTFHTLFVAHAWPTSPKACATPTNPHVLVQRSWRCAWDIHCEYIHLVLCVIMFSVTKVKGTLNLWVSCTPFQKCAWGRCTISPWTGCVSYS